METAKQFYGKRCLELLPVQPSLRYPATREERREKDEEDAMNKISIGLSHLIISVKELGFRPDEAIDLIRQVLDTEFKR